MSWPSFADSAVFTTAVLFCTGIVTAIIEGFFHKPKVHAETEKERALTEQAKIDAERARIDASIKVIELCNNKLLESNVRLEKSNKELQRDSRQMQRDMQQAMNAVKRELSEVRMELTENKQATKALVDMIDRFMPFFRKALKTDDDRQEFDAALHWARATNGTA